jgi:hypothetical protein
MTKKQKEQLVIWKRIPRRKLKEFAAHGEPVVICSKNQNPNNEHERRKYIVCDWSSVIDYGSFKRLAKELPGVSALAPSAFSFALTLAVNKWRAADRARGLRGTVVLGARL